MDWGPPRKGGQGKGGKGRQITVKGAGRGKGGFGPSAGWEKTSCSADGLEISGAITQLHIGPRL